MNPEDKTHSASKLATFGDNAPSGLDRAFAVLDLIARKPCRVIDITRFLNLPWATVHRTIKKLENAQFIMRDKNTNRYEVGARLWYVGSSYLINNKALSYSLQFLANTNEINNADVQIVERIGDYSVVIHTEKKQEQIIDKTQYGYHIPLHAGSKGLVLLAFSQPKFIDEYLTKPLEQLTPTTIANVKRLRKLLDQVRQEKYSQTFGDVQPHTGSMAAPFFNENNEVEGCVCFIYLKSIADNKNKVERLKQTLMLMSHSVSTDLGWRPGKNYIV
tara:strand:- start:4197 stop:5018 length:822 start_codon:yes stop_codon:yes gene_type:complete